MKTAYAGTVRILDSGQSLQVKEPTRNVSSQPDTNKLEHSDNMSTVDLVSSDPNSFLCCTHAHTHTHTHSVVEVTATLTFSHHASYI